jgi:hypothetical protein
MENSTSLIETRALRGHRRTSPSESLSVSPISRAQVGMGAPFQSSALVDDRNLGSGNNSATWVIDGTENGRKLGLRPRTC